MLTGIPKVRRWPARVVAILLLLAAALVITGVSEEAIQRAGTTNTHQEAGEGGHEEPVGQAGFEGATLLGISLESPLFVGGLAVASVALAAALWVRPGRVTAALAIAFSTGAGLFDVAEIQHQAAEGSGALLVLAAVVVALRVLAVVGGVVILRDRRIQPAESSRSG